MRSNKSKAPRVLLSTIAALGLALLPLVPGLGHVPIAYAAFDIQVDDSTITVSESGSSDSFNVKLSDQPAGDVFIRIENPDNSEITVVPMTLTFTPVNWNVNQPVTVTGVDDSQADGSQVTTIRLVADPPSDAQYLGKVVSVQATTLDNEAGFIVSKTSMTVSESGTSDTFTVKLTMQPNNGSDIVIKVTSGDTSEATVNRSTLTFTQGNWDQAQSVRVTGEDDSSADGSQTTAITLSVDDAATTDDRFDSAPDQTVSVTTTDNENLAGFTVNETDGSTRMTEGQTDSFTVVLNKQPTSNVVITVTTSDSSEVSLDKTQLTFTRDNWNTPQTVTVRAVDDILDDGDKSSTITLSVLDSASDDEFDSLSDRNIAVTTVDNDPMARFAPAPLFPAENTKLSGLSTELRWTPEPGAQWFHIQVIPANNDGPGINLIIGDPSIVASGSYVVEDPDFGSANPNYVILADIRYMWHVRTATTSSAPAESDWTPWSADAHFETANKNSNTISLVTSGNVGSERPALVWSNSDDDVFYYEVQVSRDANFCNSVGCPMLYWELKHGGVTSPLNSYTIPSGFPLQNGTTYFWRVRPRIQGDGTPVGWSAAASFRTP